MASSPTKRGGGSSNQDYNAMDEVEEVFQELSSRERVRGVIATTTEGATIKSTLEDDEATAKYAQLAATLCEKVRNAARDAGDNNDEPLFFQVKTRRQEIFISPSKKYTLVMVADLPQQDGQQ